MPQPIVPMHRQESMSNFFGDDFQPEFQMSEIQSILLKPTAADRAQKKYSVNYIRALEEIDKNTDIVVTAVSSSNERYCSVPAMVDDDTLLTLKAEGLISGYGRSVKITDRGRTALKDHYLSGSNALDSTKGKEKFDYRSFARIASNKNGLRK